MIKTNMEEQKKIKIENTCNKKNTNSQSKGPYGTSIGEPAVGQPSDRPVA